MPFKKTHQQDFLSAGSAHSLFTGRDKELLFFAQQILHPEEPSYNILSIWGPGGVGKTTLLSQMKRQATIAGCLVAWVDEQQSTSASIMEKFAQQLHLGSAFSNALHHYKEILQFLPPSPIPPSLHRRAVTKAPDLAGSLVEGIPLAGPLLREITKVVTEHVLDHVHTQQERSAVPFTSPLESLTQVFVTELNHLAEGKGTSFPGRAKREQKILLFFDTFEQVADEVVPWLLHCVLEQEIHPTIVLVIAGRDPLERSTAASPKQWLPYYEMQTMYELPVDPFTYEETSAYLAGRGITTKERISTIWHLSHGLPLYLGLLASHRKGMLDPTKDVVDNFLSRIPDSEPIKRRLTLDAALFSKPFNLDDLEAFPYLPEQERPALYAWLIRQPFIRSSSLEGRYLYHDLVQELFQRYLLQHSHNTYYASRKALVCHYQRVLEHLQIRQEKNRYGPSEERLEVMLALAAQRFFLADEESHFQALLPLLDIAEYDDNEQVQALLRWLVHIVERLSQKDPHAYRVAQRFLHFLQTLPQEYDLKNKQAWLHATDDLLTLVNYSPLPELHAYIYDCCGWGFMRLGEHQQALMSFEHALVLCPDSARLYNGRGWARFWLEEYQQAISDFDHGLRLAPSHPHLYMGRGLAYRRLKLYQEALSDFNHAIQLGYRDFIICLHRANVYVELKEYEKAFSDWNHFLEVAPAEHYQRGLVYFRQGCFYLRFSKLHDAMSCFTYSYEHILRQSEYSWAHDMFLWTKIWSTMCQAYPHLDEIQQLHSIAEGNHYIAYTSQGVLLWLQGKFREALTKLQYATTLHLHENWYRYQWEIYWREWDALFWLGMTYFMLNQEEEARVAIEQALALEMPPILLRPLRWFEHDRPKVYEQFIKPLLNAYDL